MSRPPRTHYAQSGDVNIAYSVAGDGPVDLVYCPGFVSNVELFWESPIIAPHLRRLSAFARTLVFDKRGVGMSDPWHGASTLDERMDDIRAVMDAAGMERAAIFAVSEGGPMALVFAATYPERVSELVLYGTGAKFAREEDYPVGLDRKVAEPFLEVIESRWGDEGDDAALLTVPSRSDDPAFREEWMRFLRRSASPRMAADLMRMNYDIDVRAVLASVRAPSVVLHRTGDLLIPVEIGRWLAEHLPDARFVELPGSDHIPFVDSDQVLDEVEEFLTGQRSSTEADRALATVLFTDVVGSTDRAVAEGDRRWQELLDHHDRVTRREIERMGGRPVKSTGDGFLATFDRPGRGLEAAAAILEGVRALGLELRVGLHTGEIEVRDGDVGGIAVHIAARVMDLAGPGEILVSRTLKDLVVGSPAVFDDRGAVQLKGVPGEWELFAVRR